MLAAADMSDTEDRGFDGASFSSVQSPGSTSPTRKQNKETTLTVSAAMQSGAKVQQMSLCLLGGIVILIGGRDFQCQ